MRHHPGAVAALPTLNGQPVRDRAGALPSHPPGDARYAANRRIQA